MCTSGISLDPSKLTFPSLTPFRPHCELRKGQTVLYLSTHDKQDFYRHVGYEECESVTSLGANGSKLSKTQLSGLLGAFGGKQTQANDPRTWMKKALKQ
jgi:hypothetical protein